MHDALAAEHRARYAMQSAQWAHDNAAPPDEGDGEDPVQDQIDLMTVNPAKIEAWLSDAASPNPMPDRPISMQALLVWEHAATFEGLMTAIIGGDEAQALKAVYLLRERFEDWARDRVEGV